MAQTEGFAGARCDPANAAKPSRAPLLAAARRPSSGRARAGDAACGAGKRLAEGRRGLLRATGPHAPPEAARRVVASPPRRRPPRAAAFRRRARRPASPHRIRTFTLGVPCRSSRLVGCTRPPTAWASSTEAFGARPHAAGLPITAGRDAPTAHASPPCSPPHCSRPLAAASAHRTSSSLPPLALPRVSTVLTLPHTPISLLPPPRFSSTSPDLGSWLNAQPLPLPPSPLPLSSHPTLPPPTLPHPLLPPHPRSWLICGPS